MRAGKTVKQSAEIVMAYVANNHVSASGLPTLLATVHAAIDSIVHPNAAEAPAPEKLSAAQIPRSITPEALISFEDGRSYKMLRRHLTNLGLTPETYRIKWGLPPDYPMVAVNYSLERASIARSIRLGRRSVAAAPELLPTPALEAAFLAPRKRKKAIAS